MQGHRTKRIQLGRIFRDSVCLALTGKCVKYSSVTRRLTILSLLQCGLSARLLVNRLWARSPLTLLLVRSVSVQMRRAETEDMVSTICLCTATRKIVRRQSWYPSANSLGAQEGVKRPTVSSQPLTCQM